METIFEFSFVQCAVLAAVLSGISCGILGSYMVSRRLLFLGGGITHSSLGGIGLAYWAGFSTTLGALIVAVLAGFGIQKLSESRAGHDIGISKDSASSLVWSGGMALGVVFIFLTPGYAPNLMTYLFGNLLLTTPAQLIWLAVFNTLLITMLVFWGRTILYCAMDGEYAKSQGLPVRFVSTIMLVTIATGIVLCIMSLGIMLMLSMLTLPVLVARLFSSRFWSIMALSCIVAFVGALAGLWLSYLYDLPTSAISVVVFCGMMLLGWVVRAIFCLCRP